jgi:hypothetical protein
MFTNSKNRDVSHNTVYTQKGNRYKTALNLCENINVFLLRYCMFPLKCPLISGAFFDWSSGESISASPPATCTTLPPETEPAPTAVLDKRTTSSQSDRQPSWDKVK